MNNNKIPERVKEQNVRTIALQVVLISTFAILFKQPILMLLLSADFILRALINSKYSPLAIISRKFLADILPFRNKIILLRPKKFAASIGVILSLAAGIFGLIGQTAIMIYITGILLTFSVLETFFKFCAGCRIFSILIRLNIISEDKCIDCSVTTVE
ncbi:MAG: DUF4395 domain-containing protein [Spirochaetia bacterium]|jgi:hypothetical protein|nr:DUF4395 domain-containing protein [Spirochaetia bacterium]